MGGLASFSLSLTAVNVVASLVTVYGLGLATGGPVVMVWGWVGVALGFTLVGLALGEVGAAHPGTGGVYYWTGCLAPHRHAGAWAYACGWASYLAYTGCTAAFAYTLASLCSALAAAVRAPAGAFDLSGTVPPPPLPPAAFVGFSAGATVGLALAALAAWAVLNSLRVDQQAWVVTLGALLQAVTAVAVVTAVLAGAPTLAPPRFVFTTFVNGTGWDDRPAYVALLGLLYSLFAFTGFDAAGQLGEETRDAARAAPRGMVACCIATAGLGWALTLALLFATPDPAALLANPYVGTAGANQPVVALLFGCAGRAGGAALTALLAANLFLAGVSALAANARIVFALARDGGVPGAQWLRRVSGRTGIPLRAVAAAFAIDALLLLLTLSSSSIIYNVSSTPLSPPFTHTRACTE
jgi:amino acid transporter